MVLRVDSSLCSTRAQQGKEEKILSVRGMVALGLGGREIRLPSRLCAENSGKVEARMLM